MIRPHHMLQRWQGAAAAAARGLGTWHWLDTLPGVTRQLSVPAGRADRPSDDPNGGVGQDAEREAPGQAAAEPAGPQQQQQQQQQQHGTWQSTVNWQEAEKFAGFSREWWADEGPFKPLHRMNPVRVRFIADALCDNYGLDRHAGQPLAGLRLLDVGCGGGILSEALARLGAHVVGLDVNGAAIGAAAVHAMKDPYIEQLLDYRMTTAEELAAEGADIFDAVVASEVIEHVKSLPHFCASLAALTKPGGAVVVTTLNRTPRSLALAVVAAEYILRWVPAGTHDWSKFLTPEELCMLVEESTAGDLQLEQVAGMVYNPLSGEWSLSTDTAINYASYFKKRR